MSTDHESEDEEPWIDAVAEDSESEEETPEYERYLQRVDEASSSIAIMKKHLAARAAGVHISAPELDGEIALCRMRLAECSAEQGGDEDFATIHFNALLHLCYDPDVYVPPGDAMRWYLGEAYELAKDCMLGLASPAETARRRDALFNGLVAINNRIDHEWTEGQKYVSAIHQNSEREIEVANPAYVAPPEDYLAYLKYVRERDAKKAADERSHLRVKVVQAVPNDNFRLIQMSYFRELQMLLDFGAELERRTTDVHAAVDTNNVGWVAGLLCNQQCYLVVSDIREKIYYGYVLPGNVREMQLSIETPLRQLKPRDILYQIGSPIYLDHISPYFATNIGLLWDDLKCKGDMDMRSFVWDVRQNIVLYFFYFLHLTRCGRTAFDIYKRIMLVSIYTLRYEALSLDAVEDGYLLGFARKWYLFQKGGRVSCYAGPYAMENALYAWTCYVYGREHAFSAIVGMVEEQALPDVRSTMDNVAAEGTYASTVMENSIFIK